MFIELKHHSASSINKFVSQRALWYLEKLKKIPFKGNQNTARGKAVEEGMNKHFEGYNEQECIRHACQVFTENTIGMIVVPTFRATIAPMVKEGIKSITSSFEGTPAMQGKIHLDLPSVQRPIIGYLDYDYDKMIVDNKVSGKTPNELSLNYKIQGAIYKEATGKDVYFHYVIPLKESVKTKIIKLSDAEYKQGILFATKAAEAIEKVIDSCVDYDTMMAFCFPNPGSMFGGEEEALVMKHWEVYSGDIENEGD